ncbi:hypothetical protein GT037_010286 [Alternaria burnsii]|uniref:Uncharacterized protein n=1 Tax=Alternaria burnsii TaxID=1187904 RepID=A0A8H7EBS3_9PLEO|nr:uncharacterized protein GT037_010286 [Alternaria burnsii]KAF7671764.1 hypothetical protein GT037_010286 [Alternaria burnsii]
MMHTEIALLESRRSICSDMTHKGRMTAGDNPWPAPCFGTIQPTTWKDDQGLQFIVQMAKRSLEQKYQQSHDKIVIIILCSFDKQEMCKRVETAGLSIKVCTVGSVQGKKCSCTNCT